MDLRKSVAAAADDDMNNLKATELRLGLPGTHASEYHTDKLQNGCGGSCNKRTLSHDDDPTFTPPPKAQIVGWPPVRSYRKNTMQEKMVTSELLGENAVKNNYVKVSVDGEPFVRKMDLKLYKGYKELLKALETMFKLSKIGEFSENEGYMKNSSNYEPIYEDKDGDWMLIGDVPWKMFLSTCKRLRIKRQT